MNENTNKTVIAMLVVNTILLCVLIALVGVEMYSARLERARIELRVTGTQAILDAHRRAFERQFRD